MQTFGPSFVVILYTIISHFGWPILCVAGQREVVINSYLTRRHLYEDFLSPSLSASFLACAAFTLGWRFWYLRAGGKKRRDPRDAVAHSLQEIRETRFGRSLTLLCAATIYAFAFALAVFTIRSGLLSLTYTDVKSVFADSPIMARFQGAFWVAVVTLAALASRRDLLWVAFPLGVIAFLFLASGNRNDILYPLAAALGIYVQRRGRAPVSALVVGFSVLFVLSPWIADTRSAAGSGPELSLRITDSIAELGGQIQPFSVIMSVVGSDVPHMLGMTMLMPSVVIISWGMIWTKQDYLTSNLYTPNLLAQQGHVGQGFSMIAELWVNFGSIGMTVGYLVLGILMVRLETRTTGRFVRLGFGVLTLLLVHWARNSLAFDVALFVYFAILYLAALVLSSGMEREGPRTGRSMGQPGIEVRQRLAARPSGTRSMRDGRF